MNVTLIYLDNPFWRIELARIPLFIGGISFNDKRIPLEEFRSAKETGFLKDGTKLPFHQIPCLIVDGVPIAQTGAIARFCGKLSGLYPKNDDHTAALIDQIIDAAQDINYLVTLSGRDKDPERKKIARDILANKHLPKWFQFLENLLKQNTKSVYFVESDLTIADLAIWRLLGWLKSGMLDGVPSNILDNYDNLNQLRDEIYKHPKVNEWMMKTYGKII